MKKKPFIILGACLLLGVALVVTLYATSYKIVHEPNNFLREYAKQAAHKSGELDIEFNSWYLAGVTSDKIYFGSYAAPFRMLVVNPSLTDTQHVQLRIKGMTEAWVYTKTRIKIDSPYFFIADGVKPAIYRGKLGQWDAESIMKDTAFFSQLAPISPSSFALRTNSPQTLDYILGKIQNRNPYIRVDSTLLEKQIDGLFDIDGELLYNNELNFVVYTYYYRNGYVVCDTSMNLVRRGHTIDTFYISQVKVDYVKSDHSKVLSQKKTINRISRTSGNYLFINSPLLAKNDENEVLDELSIIDVYNLISGKYVFTLMIKKPKKEVDLRDFMIYQNKLLFGIYDQTLVKYDLDSRHFE